MKKKISKEKHKNMGNLKKNINGESSGTMKTLISGLLTFLIILVILSVILTLVAMYTNISDSTVNVLYITILLISALFGGFKTGRKCSQKGLIHGFAVGLILCLAALAYTGITTDISAYDAVIKSLVVMIATSIGGIIGVK